MLNYYILNKIYVLCIESIDGVVYYNMLESHEN